MNIQAAIRSLLLAYEEISDLVGDQIRPDKLGEKDNLAIRPGIILEAPGFDALVDLSGVDSGEGQGAVNVVCVAHSRTQADAVETAVRDILSGYRGAAGPGVFIESLVYIKTQLDHEPPDDDSDGADWYLNVVTFDVFARG